MSSRKRKTRAEQNTAAAVGGPPRHRVLAIDGGPAGLLQIRLLYKIEQKIPGFIAATDLFAGTSQGALIGMFIASRLPANKSDAIRLSPDILRDAIDFSNQIVNDLHPRPWNLVQFLSGFRPLVETKALTRTLRQHIGDMRFRELQRQAVVVSMSLNELRAQNYEWLDAAESPHGDEEIVNALMATSSMPIASSIFGNASRKHFVDGAFVANNPSMVAMTALLERDSDGSGRRDGLSDADVALLAGYRLISLGLNLTNVGVYAILRGTTLLPECLIGSAYASGMLPWGILQLIVARPTILPALLYSGQNDEIARHCMALLGQKRFFRYAPKHFLFKDIHDLLLGTPEKLIRRIDEAADYIWATRDRDGDDRLTEFMKFINEEWI